MCENLQVFDEIRDEAERIIEDTNHSQKGHFSAATTFSRTNLLTGLGAAVLSAFAGISALTLLGSSVKEWGTVAAFASTIISVVHAFVKPNTRQTAHLAAGNKYLDLRNQARMFVNIDLKRLRLNEAMNKLEELSSTRSKLNSESPQIQRRSYRRALRWMKKGEAEYKVDSKK